VIGGAVNFGIVCTRNTAALMLRQEQRDLTMQIHITQANACGWCFQPKQVWRCPPPAPGLKSGLIAIDCR
jgi:hypothetical protein